MNPSNHKTNRTKAHPYPRTPSIINPQSRPSISKSHHRPRFIMTQAGSITSPRSTPPRKTLDPFPHRSFPIRTSKRPAPARQPHFSRAFQTNARKACQTSNRPDRKACLWLWLLGCEDSGLRIGCACLEEDRLVAIWGIKRVRVTDCPTS